MKKIILTLSFLMGSLLSFNAFAATTFVSTDEVTGGTAGECPLLSEDVDLSVSANVVGGWACDETNNIIQVAACHPGGSRETGVACVDQDPNTAGDQLPAGCSDPSGFSDIPSFKAFFASSQGGVMQEKVLDQRCTESQLGGLSDWAN